MGLVILRISTLNDIQLEALAFNKRSKILLIDGIGKITFRKAKRKIGITQNKVLITCNRKDKEPIKNRGRILDNIDKSRERAKKEGIIP